MIPRQEQDGVLRLHIFGMRFFDKRGHQFAGLAVVSAKFCMILVTVQLYEIKTLSVGRPTDIGEITVGRIAGIQVNGFLSVRIIDTYGNLMAEHPCHRITYLVHQCYSGSNIHQRIGSYHAFVHAVKGQQISLRTPEGALADSEFIAVYALPAYNSFGFFGYGFVVYEEVILNGIGYVSAFRGIVNVCTVSFSGLRQTFDEFIFLEIINDVSRRQFDKHIRFVRPWKLGIVEMLYFISLMAGCYGCFRRSYQ